MFGKILKGLVPSGPKEKGSLLKERREYSRVCCELEVECKQDKAEFRAVISELSPGGVKLTHSQALDLNSELLLSYKPGGVPQGRQRIKARVVWSVPDGAGHEIGLKFTDTQDNMDKSWAFIQLRKLGLDPLRTFRRQARRFACNIGVQAADAEGIGLGESTLVNIGQGGALLRLGGLIPPGKNSRIEVCFEDLKLFARVLGCRNGEGGFFVNLRFLNHPESEELKQLSLFLQRLK